MKCPKCGTNLPDDSLFCTECGCNIAEEQLRTRNERSNEQSLQNNKSSAGLKAFVVILLIACSILGYKVYCQYEQVNSLNGIISEKNSEIEKKDKKIESQNKSIDELNKSVNNLKNSANNYNTIVSFMKNSNAGYGSAKYYANKQILFLNKNDKSKTINVTAKFDGEYTVYFQTTNGNIEAKWSKTWNNNTTQLIVSPVYTGTTEIIFTSNKNSTSFKVLAVVYE